MAPFSPDVLIRNFSVLSANHSLPLANFACIYIDERSRKTRMEAMHKGAPNAGPREPVVEVRAQRGQRVALSVVDDDPESVLEGGERKPGIGEGDSASACGDKTGIANEQVEPGSPEEAEVLDRLLAAARKSVTMEAFKVLQSSEFAASVARISNFQALVKAVSVRALGMLRPWLLEQAHVPTTLAQVSSIVEDKTTDAVREAVRRVLSRVVRQ
ncbi:MAG: hypothetical protein ABIG34_04015 [Candidatus Peregrinibacteria bacterium]